MQARANIWVRLGPYCGSVALGQWLTKVTSCSDCVDRAGSSYHVPTLPDEQYPENQVADT